MDTQAFNRLFGLDNRSSSGRTDLSRSRQQAQYDQHVRNGNDAVRNNPQQR